VRIRENIEAHENANKSYIDLGLQLLEIASRADELFEKQDPAEKRRFLDFLVSNAEWKDGALTAEFREPFDMIAKIATEHREKKAAGASEEALHAVWRPQRESKQLFAIFRKPCETSCYQICPIILKRNISCFVLSCPGCLSWIQQSYGTMAAPKLRHPSHKAVLLWQKYKKIEFVGSFRCLFGILPGVGLRTRRGKKGILQKEGVGPASIRREDGYLLWSARCCAC
jgi:hypothetical protein